MKIALVHPTRQRPDRAHATVRAWLDDCEVPDGVTLEYWLSVEEKELGKYMDVIAALQEDKRFQLRLAYGKRVEYADMIRETYDLPIAVEELRKYLIPTTKINAIVRDANADWNIVVADNFMPPAEWLKLFLPQLREYKGSVKVLGYHYERVRRMLSHPIFTREFFQWNGNTVFHEEYYHTHADVDLFLSSTLYGTQDFLPPDAKPDHQHPYHTPTVPEDELCRLNNNVKSYRQGEAVWQRRKAYFASISSVNAAIIQKLYGDA